MTNFKVTTKINPFMANIKGVGIVNLHNISDTLAKELHEKGNPYIEPIKPEPPQKNKS